MGRWVLLCCCAARLMGAPASDSLFQAIRAGNAAAVKRLIVSGASPDARDSDGTPALMAAALYAGADTVKVLLECGADPNAASASGATALMWAVPDLAKTRLLLDYKARVDVRSGTLARTPFLIAAGYPGSVEVLKLLAAAGADIHARDKNGIHALGRAAVSADLAVVRYLVESGLDPNQPGYGFFGTLRFARRDKSIADYLLSKGARLEPPAFAFALTWHDPHTVERWIASGADLNFKVPNSKRTPLMTAVAAEGANSALVQLLLEKGADPNAEDAEGERPLDWAAYRHDQQKIDFLRQYGAEPGHGLRGNSYPAPSGIADARVSVARSVALLLPSGAPVFQQRGCVTCHNHSLPAEAAVAARARGIAVNGDVQRKNLQQMLAVIRPLAEDALQGELPPGNALTVGYLMAAMSAERQPFDRVTASSTHLLLATQMDDGSWLGNGVSRPPMEDSTISHTAMAVRALTLYPIPGRKNEVDSSLVRARRWLLAAKPRNTEERNLCLMGLAWTGAAKPDIEDAIAQVLAAQESGGGWAQRPGDTPDAYATGQSLNALFEAGVPATADVFCQGVAFLLRTQYADGSWLVRTRSYPVQPYMESGYPFGPHQWISAAGASWATLAIARTL